MLGWTSFSQPDRSDMDCERKKAVKDDTKVFPEYWKNEVVINWEGKDSIKNDLGWKIKSDFGGHVKFGNPSKVGKTSKQRCQIGNRMFKFRLWKKSLDCKCKLVCG